MLTRQVQWLGSKRIGPPLSFSLVTVASLTMAAAVRFVARKVVDHLAAVTGGQ